MFDNLIKIFAQEIHAGNWQEDNVPEKIKEGIENELERLRTEDTIKGGELNE